MTLRPITFNAQSEKGFYPTVALGFDYMGHDFAVHPHTVMRNIMLVSHVQTGFQLTQIATNDPEVAMAGAMLRLTHLGALHLDRAIAKAKAMDVPRVAAI